MLSLLTPEYQQRFVQQMYHYSGSNAAQWPGSYCWPEGFMRRFAQYGGARVALAMTPDLVLDIRNAAGIGGRSDAAADHHCASDGSWSRPPDVSWARLAASPSQPSSSHMLTTSGHRPVDPIVDHTP